jgi:hypothetical protein
LSSLRFPNVFTQMGTVIAIAGAYWVQLVQDLIFEVFEYEARKIGTYRGQILEW